MRVTNFNPRSREGSDVVENDENVPDFIFQSTLPRRERLLSLIRLHQGQQFQSTLPRRERRKNWSERMGRADFNPRSREGSDTEHAAAVAKEYDFNPRSREGSDRE